jgi:hypothetical protein
MKRTFCALVAASYISGCATMAQPAYEPADPAPAPVETAASNETAWKVVKIVAAVALIAGLVALTRGIPMGVPAMH